MKLKNAILLLLTAAIWGVAFVAQSVGMDYIGPLTFNCVRSLMGGAALLPLIWFLNKNQDSSRVIAEQKGSDNRWNLLRRGSLSGQQCPAVWNSVYNCGKGWIHYGLLHYNRSYIGAVFKEEMQSCHYRVGFSFCDRTLPAVHVERCDGGQQRGFADADMRSFVCDTYSGN